MIIQQGIDLIKKYEGCRLKPYLCSANVPTIGYGNTFYPGGADVKLTDKPITQSQAESLFLFQLDRFEKGVDNLVRTSIDEYQKAALVSLAYNIGLEALNRSTLLRKVNTDPNDLSIAKEFLRWVYADGKKSPGLVSRRTAEANLYFL